MKNKKNPWCIKKSENKLEKTKEVKQLGHMDVEKTIPAFNLQTKLSKLKISIPFNELLKNNKYREKSIECSKLKEIANLIHKN